MTQVVDTGPGIRRHVLDRLFSYFTKRDSTKHQKYSGGIGMGLTVVKYICTELGGNVWVESQQGKGATFTFTISDSATSSMAIANQSQVKCSHIIFKNLSMDELATDYLKTEEDDEETTRTCMRFISPRSHSKLFREAEHEVIHEQRESCSDTGSSVS